MIHFISKKEKIKNIGMVVFSFGLLFEGIEIMGKVMKPLASSPFFLDLMGKVTHVPGVRRTAWYDDDSGGTEQFCDHCGAAEFRIPGGSGWCQQCHWSDRSDPDPAGR